MTALSSWDVQKAVVAALKGYSPNIAGDRIYDQPPATVAFPYVEIGETQILQDDVIGRTGADEFLNIHIWSRGSAGKKEVREIAAQVENALHVQPFTVAGLDTLNVWVRDLRIFRDPDGQTNHGVLTVRLNYFGPLQET